VAGVTVFQLNFCDPHGLDKVFITKAREQGGFFMITAEMDVGARAFIEALVRAI